MLALLAVRVPVKFFVLPTLTLPKANVDGENDNCAVVVVVPVPCNGTVAGSVAPTTSIENVPVAAPLVVGLNETLRSALCPAASSIGTVLLDENPVPLAVTLEMVTLGPPLGVEFVRVRCIVLVVLTVTLPKSRLEALKPTCAAIGSLLPPGVALDFVTELQADKPRIAVTRIAARVICFWLGGFIFILIYTTIIQAIVARL